jgi:hypothetical protein
VDAVINAFLLAQWSMHLRGAQCSMNICEYGGQCIFLVSTVVNALLLVHSGQCIFVSTQWPMHFCHYSGQCSCVVHSGQCTFVRTVANALLLVHISQYIFVSTVANALL